MAAQKFGGGGEGEQETGGGGFTFCSRPFFKTGCQSHDTDDTLLLKQKL